MTKTKKNSLQAEKYDEDSNDFVSKNSNGDIRPPFDAQLIVNGLWLGSYGSSLMRQELEDREITHVLALWDDIFEVPFPRHFKYKVILCQDSTQVDIFSFFPDAFTFIHDAISSGGQILVHCGLGPSRSATVVIGYLMSQHRFDLKRTAERVMPALQNSKFVQEGVLTPEEFVAAGDLLVFKCQTWSWVSGDPDKVVSYLPSDKQFLITRNASLEQTEQNTKTELLHIDGDDDDWVATSGQTNKEDEEEVPEILPSISSAPLPRNDDNNDEEDSDGEVPDIEDFNDDDNIILDDPATLRSSEVTDNIETTRTYDLSITYDFYYRTPKVWLFGYNEKGQPLQPTEIFEDISADHAHKTVTIDQHQHLGIFHAFIHPCRHAPVMKKIIQRHIEAGKEARVDQYIILFIKFISAVIPTIEYDYTMEIEG